MVPDALQLGDTASQKVRLPDFAQRFFRVFAQRFFRALRTFFLVLRFLCLKIIYTFIGFIYFCLVTYKDQSYLRNVIFKLPGMHN